MAGCRNGSEDKTHHKTSTITQTSTPKLHHMHTGYCIWVEICPCSTQRHGLHVALSPVGSTHNPPDAAHETQRKQYKCVPSDHNTTSTHPLIRCSCLLHAHMNMRKYARTTARRTTRATTNREPGASALSRKTPGPFNVRKFMIFQKKTFMPYPF